MKTGFWTKFFSFCCAFCLLIGQLALAERKVVEKRWWLCDKAISTIGPFLPAITRSNINRLQISTMHTSFELIRLEIPQGVGIVSPKLRIVPSMTVNLRAGQPLHLTLLESNRPGIERSIAPNTRHFYQSMFEKFPTDPENLNFLDGMPELSPKRIAQVTRKGKVMQTPILDLKNVASVTYETAMDVDYTYFINP